MAKSRPMELNPAWKGGRTVMSHGYVAIKMPSHPNASKSGYVLEHVLIASQVLGKPLPHGAIVHHVNGNNSDNRKENLVILQSKGEHQRLHSRMRAKALCGNSKWHVCAYCGEYDDPQNMSLSHGVRQDRYWHKACSNSYARKRRNIKT